MFYATFISFKATSQILKLGAVAVAHHICDRIFCNLEAVAQRLVGSWTGNAIRLLTFKSWNTDVVSDFLAAKCPKVVANDAADEIIHDYSSLKSGLSFASELTRGVSNGIGWMMSAPIEYRLADLEGVSVTNPAALTFNGVSVTNPAALTFNDFK